ncbi:MAG: MFS transporter [Streptosporangiales bacterium]|nr:MFS transporter [Streptosporangiales bacterium]
MTVRTYPALLRTPGVAVLLASSLAARTPNTMIMIAMSFWARDLTGTFAWSGVLIGTYTAGVVVAGPRLGRLVDRYGPPRVLLPCGVVWSAGFVVLAVLPASVWWVGLGVSLVTGAALPPVSAAVRAVWPRLVRGDQLRTAYTLEATAQELMFAVGPMLAAVLVTFAGSRFGMAGCGVVGLAGVVWCASRPALRAGGTGAEPSQRREGILRHPGRFSLIAGMALLVAAFSAVQLGIVAFAEASGDRLLSGVLELVWSLASLAGGLVAGAVGARRGVSPWRRVAIMSVGVAGCVVAPGPWWLGVALIAAGAMIAPTMAAAYECMGELAPPGASAEAFAWLSVAAMAGSGVGATLGGQVVTWYGPSGGFALGVVLCVVAVAALLPAGRTGTPAALAGRPALAPE